MGIERVEAYKYNNKIYNNKEDIRDKILVDSCVKLLSKYKLTYKFNASSIIKDREALVELLGELTRMSDAMNIDLGIEPKTVPIKRARQIG